LYRVCVLGFDIGFDFGEMKRIKRVTNRLLHFLLLDVDRAVLHSGKLTLVMLCSLARYCKPVTPRQRELWHATLLVDPYLASQLCVMNLNLHTNIDIDINNKN
jgi:hypothetical protein